MAIYKVYAYITMDGDIEIPDDITEDEAHDYIGEHLTEVNFNEPWIDYQGTEFEVEPA